MTDEQKAQELLGKIDLLAREYDFHDFGLPHTTNDEGKGHMAILEVATGALRQARLEGMRDGMQAAMEAVYSAGGDNWMYHHDAIDQRLRALEQEIKSCGSSKADT